MSIIQTFFGTNLTISEGGGGGGGGNPTAYPPTLSAISGSMRFNDGLNDYFSYTSDPQDWAVGTGDYTVEWYQWMLETSDASARPFSVGTWPAAALSLSLENGTCYLWGENNSAGYGNNMVGWFGYTAADYFNTWVHVAVSRVSGVTYVLFNGVQMFSTSQTYNVTNTGNLALTVGNQNDPNTGGSFVGYIKDFRFIKGVGLYNGAFDIPKYPLTATTETVLLLSVNDSNNIVTDSSSRVHTGTGSVYWSEVSPYGIVFEVDAADSNSYDALAPTVWTDLSPNDNNFVLENVTNPSAGLLNFGTTGVGTMSDPFGGGGSSTPRASISFWANIKSNNDFQHIAGCRGNDKLHVVLLNNNTTLECRVETDTGYYDINPDITNRLNTMTHYAFVANGDRIDFYINGVSAGNTAISGNYRSSLGAFGLAQINSGFQAYNLDVGRVRFDVRARCPREIARECEAQRSYYGV